MFSIKFITKQIIQGIAFLNSLNIIHKDIKPDNVLFNKDKSVVKIIDLGVSSQFDTSIGMVEDDSGGTWRYMSPEQFRGQICLKSDVWAFGCVLLEMCTGHPPFHKISNDE